MGPRLQSVLVHHLVRDEKKLICPGYDPDIDLGQRMERGKSRGASERLEQRSFLVREQQRRPLLIAESDPDELGFLPRLRRGLGKGASGPHRLNGDTGIEL